MNRTERDELRRLIRARFKLLRSDVEQRKAELLAELETTITERFAAEDKAWADANFLVEEAAREANRKANDIYRGLFGERWGNPHTDKMIVYAAEVKHPKGDRTALRIEGMKTIDAKVKAALLELERREVDLLSDLATTALESAQARAFMGRIPTVSELVPASRLLAAIQGVEDNT